MSAFNLSRGASSWTLSSVFCGSWQFGSKSPQSLRCVFVCEGCFFSSITNLFASMYGSLRPLLPRHPVLMDTAPSLSSRRILGYQLSIKSATVSSVRASFTKDRRRQKCLCNRERLVSATWRPHSAAERKHTEQVITTLGHFHNISTRLFTWREWIIGSTGMCAGRKGSGFHNVFIMFREYR